MLVEADRRGCYARDAFAYAPKVERLDARDRGLAMRLALGATAASGCLDELLDRHLDRPGKVALRVRWALRIAAFELVYLGNAPQVAVSQGVELVSSVARGASGLANAVLRRVAADVDGYLAADDIAGAERGLYASARGAGLPVWLAGELSRGLQGRSEDVLSCELEAAPLAAQLNPRVGDPDLPGTERMDLPGSRLVDSASRFLATGVLDRADAVISDLHAQLIATAAVAPGSCLEIGAGRGTKTFVMASEAARAGAERTHVALDLYESKCGLNRERCARAGFGSIRTVAADACDLDGAFVQDDTAVGERVLFDRVLVDAPCSGTGTMRRHPEIPWRLKHSDVESGLPRLQLELLREASRRVAPEGELLYATCSVLPMENTGVVEEFLASPEGEGFAMAPVSEAWIFTREGFGDASLLVRRFEDERGLFQSFPVSGGFDGHFCARLVRVR